MRWVPDQRIVRWHHKLAFAFVVWVIPLPLFRLLPEEVLFAPWFQLLIVPLNVATFLLPARVFRGKDEFAPPPRPWWKMTAKPKLSRRLGKVFVAFSVIGALATAQSALGINAAPGDPPTAYYATQIPSFAIVAYLYLNSARRLQREERNLQSRPSLS